MSRTKDFIINNPGKNFDGSPVAEPTFPFYEPLPEMWVGLSKPGIKAMAGKLVDIVEENSIAVNVAERLSAMETFIKEVKEDARFPLLVRDEVEKNGKSISTASGAKIEAIEAGTTYDFSPCNDWELDMLEANLEAAKNALKERQEFLKKLPAAGMDAVSPEGELVKLYPPAKSSKSTYRVTLAK